MKVIKTRTKSMLEESSLLFDGLLVGILAGIIGIIYRIMITYSERVIHFFESSIHENNIYILYLAIFLIVVGFLSAFMVKKEPYSSGSGIPQVAAEVTGRINTNPFKVLFYKIFGGFFAALGGLSLGREGPSIQLGAMSGKAISKLLRRDSIKENYLVTCGASAGLSVAFNAPIAGVMFSIEEIHKNVSKKLIVSCFSAAVVADIISQYIFGFDAIFQFPDIKNLEITNYFWVAILGVCLGIFGTFYNIIMNICFSFYNKLNLNMLFRPQVAMFCSFILFLSFPIVLGSGHSLVEKLNYTSYGILFLLVLYLIKMLFSLISFTSGVAGGIFLPILVQGAILGALFSNIIDNSTNITIYIIIAMAGYLTAVVRSPLTSIILIFEMTQKLSYFLPLAICCLFAYYTANMLGTKPVYEYLLENLLKKEKIKFDGETEIELEMTIDVENKLVNEKIMDVDWGNNVFIVSIERNGKHIIPKGSTVIKPKDKLIIHITKDEADAFLEKFG